MTRRGQSSPLAVVLLIGIVLTGATTVAVLGGGSIDDVSSSAESERASQEMTQVASEAAAVALGGSQQRGMTVDASQGRLTVEENASWICVENGTTTNRSFILPEGADDDESCGGARKNMGTVQYDTGDTTVAYEGGGVWRRGDDGRARMVSPPEFHYRGDTLTLPVVVVSGDVGSGGSTVDLTATAGPTDRVDSLTNPLPDSSGSVYVTIHSEYYQAWGEFIAGRTAGRVVELDDDAKTVTVELVVPSPATIENAIYTGGDGSNAVQVQNLEVDSYGSDTYSSSDADGDGDVVTDGGVNPIEGTVDGDVYTIRQGEKVSVTSGGRVNGSIHSQRKVEIQDSGSVKEDIFAERKVTVNGDEVGGTIHSEEKVTLSNSGLSVGGVRTGSGLTFNADGVTIDGDIHAETLNDLGNKNPILSGDVYTNDTYGTQSNSAGVEVPGELHASGGIYTDDTTVNRSAYTDADLEDTDSDYERDVHVGGDADLSGTTVSGDVFVDGALDTSSDTKATGTVYVGGDADLKSTTIGGDLHVDGNISCSNVTVTGDVHHVDTSLSCVTTGSPSVTAPTSPDDPNPPKSPEEPAPDPPKIEVPPESELDPVPAGCTNDGGTIQVGDSSHVCELPPGTYDVSRLDVDQGKVIFEEGGRVELYVSNDLSLSGGNITTAPDGEHDATRVEINYYGTGGANVKTNITGVINAPNAKVDIDNSDTHIHGAIIAKKVQGDGGAQVHYDEDLSGRTVGDGKNGTTSVQYLHVTTNELEIED
ncbi:hypothetical protein BRC88_02005 [Halobacteriales archaeon QS_4_69_225]|nr:MAG: hypothetical protein BRC88_02005 [Halobacteriales archaeon QS_4_69_225]